jgi:hypothetical protein
VEVASNDGYLLRNFVARGIRALGVDPARGPAAAAAAVGVPTVVGFFGPEVARGIVAEHGHADVVIANNVMAHVPDLDDFVAGLPELLAPGWSRRGPTSMIAPTVDEQYRVRLADRPRRDYPRNSFAIRCFHACASAPRRRRPAMRMRIA